MFSVIKYQLYLLQLENYELGRYFKLLLKKGFWPKGEQRKNLVWTSKAKALLLVAFGIHIFIGIGFLYLASGSHFIVAIFLLILWFLLLNSYFLILALGLILLWPLDFAVKQNIISKARLKIKDCGPRIKIIGVAGSYGKTTMKQVLTTVLGEKFKVQSTPESINTPIGIARWILKEVSASTEILVVEMGEHYKGDIKELCELTPPDISVITGINEAHLERLGSLENAVSTIFEAVTCAKPAATVVINGDDGNILGNYKNFLGKYRSVLLYQKSNIKNQKFDPVEFYWTGDSQEAGEVKIHLIGEYALGYADAAIKVTESLGIAWREVSAGLEKVRPVEHRLQPIKSAGDLIVIDDAYNGNPEGAAEAIKVLSRFENRRKIYITPGLVETGKAAEAVHKKIGQQLAGVANVVVLIKNTVTPWIEQGIKDPGSKTKDKTSEVIWFNTAQEAHASLGKILKPGDVVVFQNDWGDQYI